MLIFCFVNVFRINLFRGELSCRGYCNGKVGKSRGIANNHGRMIYECRENLPTDLLARQVTGNRRCEYFSPCQFRDSKTPRRSQIYYNPRRK